MALRERSRNSINAFASDYCFMQMLNEALAKYTRGELCLIVKIFMHFHLSRLRLVFLVLILKTDSMFLFLNDWHKKKSFFLNT